MNSHQSTHTKHLRNDILLLVLLILVGVSAYFFKEQSIRKAAFSSVALINVNGETLYRIDLNKDDTFSLDTEFGYNMVTVKDGKIMVSKADCPDQICVNHAPISKKGEVIICLPHKLEITIIESEESIDAVAE